jgi:dethiobiotin synthetase
MKNTIAIAGIHTGIGKTIVSAVLAEALGADYWKPVQAGLEERDAALVKQLITNGDQRVHPEAVLLPQPISPHAAAAIDGITIDYTKFAWPTTDKLLLVETAGGVLSPMTDSATMADFISYYQLPTILVAQNYLGSINHTLLSIEALTSRGINILGIVISGHHNKASESFIEQYGEIPVIAAVPHVDELTANEIAKQAAAIKPNLSHLILQ